MKVLILLLLFFLSLLKASDTFFPEYSDLSLWSCWFRPRRSFIRCLCSGFDWCLHWNLNTYCWEYWGSEENSYLQRAWIYSFTMEKLLPIINFFEQNSGNVKNFNKRIWNLRLFNFSKKTKKTHQIHKKNKNIV